MKALSASSSARTVAGPSSSVPSTPDRFGLTGPSHRLDPRIHAVRRDIADVALASRVFAPHYARPLPHACIAPRVPMRAEPREAAPAVSDLLAGEGFCVVDASGDWAWGFATADHYVGYVPIAALGPPVAATHVVACPAALLFERTDIKSLLVARFPMGARLVAVDEGDDFVRTTAGFVHRRHVVRLGERAADPVAVAERLIGTPYLWGGRSGDGIDCSGLVQLALAFAGIAAPRDSDQQRALGREIDEDEPLARGDLLFWPGHVAFVADPATLLHANAHWMATVREPLADVVARALPGGGIVARRRV